MTFTIMTLSITIVSAECHYAEGGIFIVMLGVIMLDVFMPGVSAECCYAECRYAKCRGAPPTFLTKIRLYLKCLTWSNKLT